MNAAACPTGASPLATAVPASRLARIGLALRRHGRTIRMIQWAVVFVYLALLLIPAALPLPPEDARLFGHLGTIAQFVFWGIWWPFVLISMVLFGRVWCGVFCPEGALAEQASRVGLGRGIPRWLRWQGWPFFASPPMPAIAAVCTGRSSSAMRWASNSISSRSAGLTRTTGGGVGVAWA